MSSSTRSCSPQHQKRRSWPIAGAGSTTHSGRTRPSRGVRPWRQLTKELPHDHDHPLSFGLDRRRGSRQAHPEADGFPQSGVIGRLHGRRLGPLVDGSDRADFFADSGGCAEADLDGSRHVHIEIQAWALKVVPAPTRKSNADDATKNRRSRRSTVFHSHVQVVSPKQRLRRTLR